MSDIYLASSSSPGWPCDDCHFIDSGVPSERNISEFIMLFNLLHEACHCPLWTVYPSVETARHSRFLPLVVAGLDWSGTYVVKRTIQGLMFTGLFETRQWTADLCPFPGR